MSCAFDGGLASHAQSLWALECPDVRVTGNRQYCLDKAADCERKAAQARHPDAAKEFQSIAARWRVAAATRDFNQKVEDILRTLRAAASASSSRCSGARRRICALYGLKLIGDRSTKVVVAVGTWLMIAVGTCSLGSAQQAQTGGRNAPRGALGPRLRACCAEPSEQVPTAIISHVPTATTTLVDRSPMSLSRTTRRCAVAPQAA